MATLAVPTALYGIAYVSHAVPGPRTTFERFLYRPFTRSVLFLAERMKVIQAGSLHAYLAYVLILGIALLLWLGGGR